MHRIKFYKKDELRWWISCFRQSSEYPHNL